MMVIGYKDRMDAVWHIGEKPPVAPGVLVVQADGDELYYIHENFKNLPIHNSLLVQTWRGDFARFIVDNLPDFPHKR